MSSYRTGTACRAMTAIPRLMRMIGIAAIAAKKPSAATAPAIVPIVTKLLAQTAASPVHGVMDSSVSVAYRLAANAAAKCAPIVLTKISVPSAKIMNQNLMKFAQKIKKNRRSYRPKLRFSPTAWAKLLYWRDAGETEIGGFGIAQSDDPLLVTDIQLVEQVCTLATVKFADQAVADYFDQQVDRGLKPTQFARIWVHTHPGKCPEPSFTDEETFERVFGQTDWSVMFILACGGQTLCSIAIQCRTRRFNEDSRPSRFSVCRSAPVMRRLGMHEYQAKVTVDPMDWLRGTPLDEQKQRAACNPIRRYLAATAEPTAACRS